MECDLTGSSYKIKKRDNGIMQVTKKVMQF